MIATEQYGAWAIAADASGVYWTNYTGVGTINHAPLGGGSVTTLAVQQVAPSAIALDQANVYWANGVNPGAIMKVSKLGGPAIRLAGYGDGGVTNVEAYGIAVDGVNVWWTQGSCPRGDCNTHPGQIVRIPVGGGIATKVYHAQDWPLAITLDANAVYWTNVESPSVRKAAK